MPGDQPVEQRRVAEGDGADQHAVDAERDRLVDGLLGAEAAADLQHAADGPLGRQPLDQRQVLGGPLAAAGGVEVDHVQRPGAVAPEAVGDLERLAAEVGDRVEAALDEAHDPAAGEVDRGNHIEGHAGSILSP